MLEIENLVVSINGNTILKELSLSVGKGQVMTLFGPNGSGKTTLLKTIMGFPAYKIVSGQIHSQGEDIISLGMDERSRRGIGLIGQLLSRLHPHHRQKLN